MPVIFHGVSRRPFGKLRYNLALGDCVNRLYSEFILGSCGFCLTPAGHEHVLNFVVSKELSARTWWSSGYYSCFVFGRSRVQISVQRPIILTEFFRAFPQSLQTNAVVVPLN
jgi:hypothetical protein